MLFFSFLTSQLSENLDGLPRKAETYLFLRVPEWLTNKGPAAMTVDDERSSAPRIKGRNPPQSKLDQIEAFKGKVSDLDNIEWACLVAGGALGLILALLNSAAVFLVLFAMGGGYLFFRSQHQALENEAKIVEAPIILEAYNTEFTAPLADRSTLRITVHFQIPRATNYGGASSYGAATPDFVEQLNRVTEAKLITHTQRFADAPSKEDLEDYLNRQLVQFQDENHVAVMRVTVPIAIHILPDKPKGVHV